MDHRRDDIRVNQAVINRKIEANKHIKVLLAHISVQYSILLGDPCRMPMGRGTGTSVLNRWYFNTDSQACVSFTYSGRGGNQNNFVSLSDCRTICPEFLFVKTLFLMQFYYTIFIEVHVPLVNRILVSAVR